MQSRLSQAEKRQADAITRAQSEYLASLSDDWLLEYLRLSLQQRVSEFETVPHLCELDASERKRLELFQVDDAFLADYHAKGFSKEQESRLDAMEQELVDGWRARGAWLWAQ